MFHLIHERMVRELAEDRVPASRDDRRRRLKDAHTRQVERVRASIELVPRTRRDAPREA